MMFGCQVNKRTDHIQKSDISVLIVDPGKLILGSTWNSIIVTQIVFYGYRILDRFNIMINFSTSYESY
jgi:hypothetical protein